MQESTGNSSRISEKRASVFSTLAALVMTSLLSLQCSSTLASDDGILPARIEQFSMPSASHSTPGRNAIIAQIGSGNSAEIVQSASSRYQQNAVIYQRGNNNRAGIYQYDTEATATITQIGNGHSAKIFQRDENAIAAANADIKQYGSNSNVNVLQSDSGQNVQVAQYAWSGNALPVTITTYR